MAPKPLHRCRIATFGTYKKSWSPGKIKDWIEHAGGTFQSTLEDDTSHFVVTEAAWNIREPLVEKAIQAQQLGQNIKIVNFQWLADCLEEQAKKKEAAYVWHLPSMTTQSGDMVSVGSGGGTKGSRTVPGLITEVFHDSTAHYLDPKDVARVEKARAEEDRAFQEKQNKEQRALRQERAQVRRETNLFRRGALKAQNEAFADNYHVYADETGFVYDVLLTQVDIRNNTNQCLCLTMQIYESNIWPHSYAFNVNLHSKNPGRPSSNQIVAAVGSKWATVFRAFRNEFERYTWIEWQNPSEYREGLTDRWRELRQNLGTYAHGGANKYGPGAQSGAGRKAESGIVYEHRRWDYRPLNYQLSHLATVRGSNDETDFKHGGQIDDLKDRHTPYSASANEPSLSIKVKAGDHKTLPLNTNNTLYENQVSRKIEETGIPTDFRGLNASPDSTPKITAGQSYNIDRAPIEALARPRTTWPISDRAEENGRNYELSNEDSHQAPHTQMSIIGASTRKRKRDHQ